MTNSGSRRRQRSTRIVVAVVLLLVAVGAVAGAAFTASWVVATAAGFVAVLLGAVATKITHSEVLDARRHAAIDRAVMTQEFAAVDTRRSIEGIAFAQTMKAKLGSRDNTVAKLERKLADTAGELADARRELAEATQRAEMAEKESERMSGRILDADERATTAIVRVAELEAEIDVLTTQWQAAEAALAEQLATRKTA